MMPVRKSLVRILPDMKRPHSLRVLHTTPVSAGCWQNSRLGGRLKVLAQRDTRVARVYRRLITCDDSDPCGLGVCAYCHSRIQHKFAQAVLGFAADHERLPLSAITIALPQFLIPANRLPSLDLERVFRSLRYYLKRAGIRLLLGVLEIDFVEHKEGRYAPGWLPQLHGLVASCDPAALSRRLHSILPRSDVVPRPKKITAWDGRVDWLLYCAKLHPKRRVGYDTERFDPRSGRSRHCRHTRAKPLRSPELRELVPYLADHPLPSRLFAMGAQWRNADDRLLFVPLASSPDHRPV